jgi:hypothetical protein
MDLKELAAQRVVCGWLVILGGIIFVPGGLLFTGRAIFKWPAAQTRGYLYWERGLVMAAILAAALGFVLLESLLGAAGEKILAPVGLTVFLIGTVLVLAAETFELSRQESFYIPIVTFVVLAFLGQAAFGAAILRSGLLPAWVGWVTIVWNLGWLVILPIARQQDMYYPWLHYLATVLIGIRLLVGS